MKLLTKLTLIGILGLFIYTISGTGTRVDEIQKRAPADIESRGWTILRGEDYQWGAWMYHGGKVWFHVAEKNNPEIRYRIYITLWNNQLHYHYNSPEIINNSQIIVK